MDSGFASGNVKRIGGSLTLLSPISHFFRNFDSQYPERVFKRVRSCLD